jgi:hypothetical protein
MRAASGLSITTCTLEPATLPPLINVNGSGENGFVRKSIPQA